MPDERCGSERTGRVLGRPHGSGTWALEGGVSTILKALRKLERDQPRKAGSGKTGTSFSSDGPVGSGEPRGRDIRGPGFGLVLSVAAATGLLLGAGWWWSAHQEPAPAAASAQRPVPSLRAGSRRAVPAPAPDAAVPPAQHAAAAPSGSAAGIPGVQPSRAASTPGVPSGSAAGTPAALPPLPAEVPAPIPPPSAGEAPRPRAQAASLAEAPRPRAQAASPAEAPRPRSQAASPARVPAPRPRVARRSSAPKASRLAPPAAAAAPPRRERIPDVAVAAPPPEVLVLGTVWHPDPKRRRATVRLRGQGPTVVLREGDALGTLVVAKIEPSGVVFLHEGQRLRQAVGHGP